MPANTQQTAAEIDDKAYALMRSALELIPRGNLAGAAEALEEAAALHALAGRGYDHARCLQLAATLRRSNSEPGKAQQAIEQAASVIQPDQPLAVSIAAEQAEIAFAERRYEDSITSWTTALDKAREAGLKPEGLSSMLRRRAAALIAASKPEPAANDFDQAYSLLEAARGQETARFVGIEQAGLLLQHGYAELAEQVLAQLEAGLRNEPASPHLLAELLVIRARLARRNGETEKAAELARRSRENALQAVAPVSYFAASVELAEALNDLGERANAYEALTTAWATLSDVLGKDVASSWVEPVLIGWQIRWGAQGFQQAKDEYEARRRAQLAKQSTKSE